MIHGYGDGPGVVGRKAAGLARLAGAGLAVPEGFVVGREAGARFWAEAGLEASYRAAVRALAAGDRPGAAGKLAALAEAAGRAPLPGGLADRLAEESSRLLARHSRLIVRSSSAFEDMPGRSMAGVFASRGGLADPGAVAAAVKQVWLQAAAEPTLLALLQAGLDPREPGLAVLVQGELALERFCVCFSIDPRDPAAPPLVEAVAGGGAALMAGEAGPGAALPASLLDEVRRIEARARRVFGGPVDLELGIAASRITALQGRPQVLTPSMRKDVRWGRSRTRERYPLPLSPLAWSNLELVFVKGIEIFHRFLGVEPKDPATVACLIDQRVHANEDLFELGGAARLRLSGEGYRAVLAEAWAALCRRGAPLSDLFDLGGFALRPGAYETRLGDRPGSITAVLALAVVRRFFAESEARWVADWPGQVARYRAQVEAAAARLSPGLPLPVYRALSGELRAALMQFLESDLVIFGLKELAFLFLEEIFRLAGRTRTRRELAALLGILPANPTVAMGRELAALAPVLRAHGREDPRFETAWLGFLARYGHLTPSWDFKDPLVGENPEELFRVLEALGGAPVPAAPAAPAADPQAAADRAQLEVDLRPYPALAEGFTWLVEALHRTMRWDEDHHLETSRVMGPSRRLVLHLGDELAARGVLATADEVFFLADPEVWAALEEADPLPRRALVAARRAAFAKAAAQEELFATPRGRAYKGIGASRGTARGRCRRVACLADAARLAPGEILVLRTPDPVWTMLYPLAGGLVAETGGLLSHGVVSAREYGLPAVIHLDGAFGLLVDGTEVQLDGESGELRVLAGP